MTGERLQPLAQIRPGMVATRNAASNEGTNRILCGRGLETWLYAYLLRVCGKSDPLDRLQLSKIAEMV